jgi:putative hemolysin
MEIAISIIVTFLLTLANGFFSCSETALVTAKRAILEPEADDGDLRAKRAIDLASDSSEFLAAIQVAITLVGFFASAFAATNLSGPLGAWMQSLGMSPALAGVLAPVLITLLVSYLSIVVGELVPKRVALADAEGVAKSVSGFLVGFSKAVKPLVWLTAKSADGLANLMGIADPDDRQNVSEDEIKYMVTDADDLSDEEKSMIHEIFDLGDAIAREVMVPRVDMTAVEDTETCGDVLALMRRTGYSRIPVYHEDVDRIVGVAHIKDIIGPIVDDHASGEAIASHVREPDFVPDTKDIIPLLSEMQTAHDQMVIVVDEYGGTAGVITIEDIVEEVVGEIEDEFDPDNKYLTQLSEREWLVDGRFSIDDAIELGWPVEDSEEYETVAGFVLEQADALPEPGDVFNVDGYLFRVQSMRGRRIALLRVTAPKPAAPAAESTTDDDGNVPSDDKGSSADGR